MTPNTPQAMRETPMPEHLTTESALRLDLEAALAQIEALRSENVRLTAELDHVKGELEAKRYFERENKEFMKKRGLASIEDAREIRGLKDSLAAAKRDGERYRRLRAGDVPSLVVRRLREFSDEVIVNEDIDTIIDAAIEQGGRGNG